VGETAVGVIEGAEVTAADDADADADVCVGVLLLDGVVLMEVVL